MINLRMRIIGIDAVQISTHAAVCGMYTGREAIFKNLRPHQRDVGRDRVGEHDGKFKLSGMPRMNRAAVEVKNQN